MTDVTLAILAGGEAARMGRPKGELRLGGRPILRYLLDRFAWPGPTMLVTAPGREHPPGHELFNVERIDPVPGQGPLRGVLTALANATTPTVVVATVDMPGVRADQLRWLADQLAEHPQALGLMTRRGEQVEPFPAVFRRAARDSIERELEQKRSSVRGLCALPCILAVAAPSNWDPSVWTNLNRPEDVQAFAP